MSLKPKSHDMGRVLIACECSQVECLAFRAQGHDAFSADIQPCYGGHPEWHILGDVRNVPIENWDLVIAHPPCTYLSAAGSTSMFMSPTRCLRPGNILPERYALMLEARAFFYWFLDKVSCPLAIENPRPLRCAALPPWSQVICPTMFGEIYMKRTCLWLRDLPPLLPTSAQDKRAGGWLLHCSSSSNRRSRSFEGVADAMARQWGGLL